MTVAWTTVLIVILLLPGAIFFVGLSTPERYSREIVRGSAVSEVGLAFLVSVLVHTAVLLLYKFLFVPHPQQLVIALLSYNDRPLDDYIARLFDWLPVGASYVVVTAVVGFLAGLATARGVVSGWLRFLARHKWAYDLIQSRDGIITAYVLTQTIQHGRALMYQGHLEEFYLAVDGRLSYLVLKNCSRFYMEFDEAGPRTRPRAPLLATDDGRLRTWNYLVIEGDKVANVLFDKTPQVKATERGTEALDEALRNYRQEPDRHREGG